LKLTVGAGQHNVMFGLECRWKDGITLVGERKGCELCDWWK